MKRIILFILLFWTNFVYCQLNKATSDTINARISRFAASLDSSFVLTDSTHTGTFTAATITLKNNTFAAFWVSLTGICGTKRSSQLWLTFISNINGVYTVERTISYLSYGGTVVGGNGLGVNIINNQAVVQVFGKFPQIVKWMVKVSPL